MNTPKLRFSNRLATLAALAALAALATGVPVAAFGQTDIGNEPLAQPASNVKPNIVLILDDSGSMRQQYTPDYLGRYFGGSNDLCLDSMDGGSIGTNLEGCEAGDPPLMSPEVNTQYYNPEIRYSPAVNFDNTSKGEMDAAATANWTAVPTDNVSSAGTNTFRKDLLDINSGGATVTTSNLATGFPDRPWCSSEAADHTNAANYPGTCRLNSSYTYPSINFGYGKNSNGSLKYTTGAPYFYRLIATDYCTDATLTSCVTATAPSPTHPVAGPVRYCDSTALTNCQLKRSGSFTRPKFTGRVVTPSVVALPATATLVVTAPGNTVSGTITRILVNGANVIPSTAAVNAPTGTDTSTERNNTAQAIVDAVNADSGTSLYTATRSNNTVTLTAVTLGPVPNGYPVTVESAGVAGASAVVSLQVTSAGSNTVYSSIYLREPVSGNQIEILGATISAGGGSNNAAKRRALAAATAAQINANVGGHNFTAVYPGTGSPADESVRIVAPTGTGASLNGWTLYEVGNAGSSACCNPHPPLAGGITNGFIPTATTPFFGGVDANDGRVEVGNFVRVNIVPTDAGGTPSTFPKYPSRGDCAGVSCNYTEEMTNFANWYAYYRSRMQMAKTAIGRAFSGIDDSYRVGFITINPSGDIAGRFLAVADFDSTQKSNWYDKLYVQSDHGSTPLREALSRVGRYYGNVTSGINAGMPGTPIQVSCQPSYAILTTDGYWNGNSGDTLTGGAIGNEDNQNLGDGLQPPWSSRTNATYEGPAAASGTLADVAMYYYKTDLSPLPDNSPLTQDDNAPHQHMVTFTVGLGLAGELTYDKNYKEQTTGDFKDIKQGNKNWPVPSQNTESTLDDLWHAAVNGRGTFFSARDPKQLSDSVGEALSTVQSRVGAGAAAATSNLQPVAGDNFAFTAQYQTVVWTGDLKARTIDLTTGIVASAELWSAANLLNQRTHTDRKIYTLDPLDPPLPPAAPAAATDNGNNLKAFCWPGAAGTGLYPACVGEAELSVAEMALYDPALLAQWAGWAADLPAPTRQDPGGATAVKLVDFLRGDVANESQGGTTQADLFRNRASLLGDIVNAQPAYVRASPFTYLDPNYAAYKASTVSRKGTVYIAANDGMLHAFETDPDGIPYYQTAGITTAIASDDVFTGTLNTSPAAGEGAERWAYIPGIVMPNLKALAETSALFVHKYHVDGTPVVGDICFGHSTATPCAATANWHTILVAGLNAGGRGYYALDITDPDNPKGLWEFKGGADAGTNCGMSDGVAIGKYADCNLGLSFGNPVITKRAEDGKWVVLLTSGHNNINPGDGQGYLYMLDAQTGQILRRIGTGVGCDGVSTTAPCVAGTADPSGLNKLNAWVNDASTDNTTVRVYAGDLMGNLWRFQLEPPPLAPAPPQDPINSVIQLAVLKDASNVAQPITTKPELGEVPVSGGNKAVVFIGTGKLLGTSDMATTQPQTLYAIEDNYKSINAANPRFNSPRTTGTFVAQTLSAVDSATRTASSNPVDWSTVNGWYVDMPDSGERINVDPVLQLGTLVVPSNVPSTDACVAGGYGWINFFDFRTGSFIPGATLNTASTKISASLVVGVNVVKLPSGAVKTIVTTADNQQLTRDTPISPPAISGKRVSWRELVQ